MNLIPDTTCVGPKKGMGTFANASLVMLCFTFPISVAMANVFLFCMLTGWLLAGGFRYRWQVAMQNPMTFPAITLYALLLLGAIYSTGTWTEVFYSLGKYSKLVYFIVALSLIDDNRWRDRCLNAFVAAMLITLASTYANIWIDLPWSRTQNRGWGVDHTVFKDYISQGEQMSLFVLLSISRIWHSTTPREKFIWVSLALFAIVSITHLSLGRTGYVALVGVFLTTAIVAVPGKYRIASFVVVALMVAAIVMSSGSVQNRASIGMTEARDHNQTSLTSIGQRLDFLEKSTLLMRERPFLGWGTGAYPGQYCRIASSAEWCAAGKFHPHNQFVFFGVELGLIGVLVFSWFMFRPLWLARALKVADRLPIAGFVIIFMVGSLAHSSLYLSTENHFFIFMMAVLTSLASTSLTVRTDLAQSDDHANIEGSLVK